MKRGYLIVNSQLHTGKFEELADMLMDSAEKYRMSLECRTAMDLLTPVGALRSASLPDYAIFWDKDAFFAQQLEAAGVRLFNSSEAVLLCDDKARTAAALARAGICQPRTVVAPMAFQNIGYTDLSFLRRAGELLGYPMVLKECFGSFGQQVWLAHDLTEAEEIVTDRIGGRPFLMQEFISCSAGRDLRVNVVGGRVIAVLHRKNEHGDFRSNITNGGSMYRYEPTAAQADAAIAAARAVGADFAGVDILFGEGDKPIVCEVNACPHFKSTLLCTGINLADAIMQYVAGQLGGEAAQ